MAKPRRQHLRLGRHQQPSQAQRLGQAHINHRHSLKLLHRLAIKVVAAQAVAIAAAVTDMETAAAIKEAATVVVAEKEERNNNNRQQQIYKRQWRKLLPFFVVMVLWK